MVVESTKSDLEALAREAKTLASRKEYLREEDERLRRKIKDEADCKRILFPNPTPY